MNRTNRTMIALTLGFAVAAPALAPRAAFAEAPVEVSGTMRTVEVTVDGAYRPARIRIAAGERIRLVFVRRDYGPCTREVVFPTLGIRRVLPTDERVEVVLPALEAGEYPFRCGMNMIQGTLVVTAG